MTGRSNWLSLHQNGIEVTINKEFLDMKPMTGRFTFFPQLVSGTAPKMHTPGRNRFGDRLFIHVPQHQHRPIVPILNDSREKALPIEIQLSCFFLIHAVMPLAVDHLVEWEHHVPVNRLSLEEIVYVRK